MTIHTLPILQVHQPHNNIYRVELDTSTHPDIQFFPGQYLEVILPDESRCPLSIASAPCFMHTNQWLELHIQHQFTSGLSNQLVHVIQSKPEITVDIAKGNCYLDQPPTHPLVFMAAGTGFAQVKSMIEHCLSFKHNQPLFLYWGVRKMCDFYLLDVPNRWAQQGKVEFHPVVSEDDISGVVQRAGLLVDAVIEDLSNFPEAHYYISGSPQMVYASLDRLIAEEVAESHVHSDVFDYAPR
ncbi:hypothetical protein [Spartinivicinus poritis]|uniref:FAD-binding FR-type domain-containing protein n=1 Tax=Spartinivicinus poritis TaxID=2994640 RepID=A0ABT5U4Z0_9GAMM|nr:hypothetical protein [Spartinivicinus sp. A2-2]MDE1461420.1 hypothetical protein [Spartinivicinus sp. A2-2]